MVLSENKARIDRIAQRLAAVLEALGFTPNAVSYLAIVIVAVGAVLIGTHHLIVGAAVAGFGSVLDLFDGALARRLDETSAWGGYLDSLLDRFADGLAFLAVAWHYDTRWIWIVAFLAFLTAVTTSYARARVYEDADPPRDAWPDLIERGERLLILLFGAGFQGIADALGAGVQFLPWIVVVLAVLGLVTVIQRAARSKRFIEEAGGDP